MRWSVDVHPQVVWLGPGGDIWEDQAATYERGMSGISLGVLQVLTSSYTSECSLSSPTTARWSFGLGERFLRVQKIRLGDP